MTFILVFLLAGTRYDVKRAVGGALILCKMFAANIVVSFVYVTGSEKAARLQNRVIGIEG